jgi:putative ABC transport system permease protein
MIGFGIAVITLVQGITAGMSDNVIEGSARYLGGRYIVVARQGSMGSENFIAEPWRITEALEKAGVLPSLTIMREQSVAIEQELYFNGSSFRVRRVTGVDFEQEASVFKKLPFDSGGFEGMKGSRGILISRQVAQRFGARLGDEMTLRLVNRQGYIDSAQLVIQGIFNDASIFGFYTCYVDFDNLQRLLGDSGGSCRAMGFYIDGTGSPKAIAADIQAALAGAGFELFPRLRNRNDLAAIGGETWSGVRYAVLPVENYIDARVMDLIHAIELVSYLFLAMILVIILVGIRNTTQIMTRKRTREIGTIRALGMSQGRARRMVLGESLTVASLGFLIGVTSAVMILLALKLIPLAWSDGFDIFLRRGHLTWRISPFFLLLNYLALVVMTVAGSLPAARQAASVSPVAAMTSAD